MSKKNKSSAQVPNTQPYSEKQSLFHALWVGALALLVYALTLYRTVPGGDSGELIQVASQWGVAHPPGYPLYTFLAHLFSWIPLGSIASRINFFSAFCDSAAAALLTLAVARWTRNRWAGLLSGGLFAFSSLIWDYAVAAEVFALNNLFIAGLFYLVIRFQDESLTQAKTRIVLLSLFWGGLGLTNHHTFLFYAAPWIAYLLWVNRRETFQAAFMKKAPLYLIAGFLPYLYLVIAGLFPTLDSWGRTYTWNGFLTHFFRMEYGTFKLAPSALSAGFEGKTSPFWTTLGLYLADLPAQTAYLGLIFVPVGLWKTLRSRKNNFLGVCLASSFVLYTIVFFNLSNLKLDFPLYYGIHIRFWQQLNVLIFAWLGMGCAVLLEKSKEYKKEIGIAISVVLMSLQIVLNYRSHDQSHNKVFADFVHVVMKSLPQNTLLITSGDHITHSIRYFQQHEKFRTDVRVVDHAMLTMGWYNENIKKLIPDVNLPGSFLDPNHDAGTYNLKALLDANQGKFPIYLVNGIRVDDESYSQSYTRWAQGYVELILPNTQELPLEEWIDSNRKFTALTSPSFLESFLKPTWEHEVLRQYWHSKNIFAAQLVTYAQKHLESRRAIEVAISELEEVGRHQEFRTPAVLKNMGIAYQLLSRNNPQAREKMINAFKEYVEVAASNDTQLPAIIQLIHSK